MQCTYICKHIGMSKRLVINGYGSDTVEYIYILETLAFFPVCSLYIPPHIHHARQYINAVSFIFVIKFKNNFQVRWLNCEQRDPV